MHLGEGARGGDDEEDEETEAEAEAEDVADAALRPWTGSGAEAQK
jgi:hypothetical protein